MALCGFAGWRWIAMIVALCAPELARTCLAAEPRPRVLDILVEDQDVWPSWYVQAGELRGIDVDTVAIVARTIGVEVAWRRVPWTRGLLDVANARADALVGPRWTAERAAVMVFADVPLSFRSVSFLARTGDSVPWTGDPGGLAGKRIGLPRGWALPERIKNAAAVWMEVNTQEQLVGALLAGRFDLVVGNPPALAGALAEMNAANTARILHPPLDQADSNIAFARKPDLESTIVQFSAALVVFVDSEVYKDLIAEHSRARRVGR